MNKFANLYKTLTNEELPIIKDVNKIKLSSKQISTQDEETTKLREVLVALNKTQSKTNNNLFKTEKGPTKAVDIAKAVKLNLKEKADINRLLFNGHTSGEIQIKYDNANEIKVNGTKYILHANMPEPTLYNKFKAYFTHKRDQKNVHIIWCILRMLLHTQPIKYINLEKNIMIMYDNQQLKISKEIKKTLKNMHDNDKWIENILNTYSNKPKGNNKTKTITVSTGLDMFFLMSYGNSWRSCHADYNTGLHNNVASRSLTAFTSHTKHPYFSIGLDRVTVMTSITSGIKQYFRRWIRI